MRLAVHTDFEYHAVGDEVYGEHAFTLFLVRLASHVERLVLLGRLDPSPSRARYALGERVDFAGLPFYESLVRVRQVLPALAGSLTRFWRILDGVDMVWLLGPHPLQLAFALMARLRRRAVALAVRQDFPRYVRSRHPGRWDLWLAAQALEAVWRGLARFCPVVVVGPQLARRYRHARRTLEIAVSLVEPAEVTTPAASLQRSYEGELQLLSVGRLETEKNPLLLADTLAVLRTDEPRWRLVVCGEGPLAQALADRLESLGVAGSSRLVGYVPLDAGLMSLYRESHVFLHISRTEGYPQVIPVAFATGLPVVATDVGGIRDAVGDAALLVPPGDAGAAARAAQAVAGDPGLRERLIRRGHAYMRNRSPDTEAQHLVSFLQRSAPRS